MKHKVKYTEHDSFAGESELPEVIYATLEQAQAAVARVQDEIKEGAVPDYYITCSEPIPITLHKKSSTYTLANE